MMMVRVVWKKKKKPKKCSVSLTSCCCCGPQLLVTMSLLLSYIPNQLVLSFSSRCMDASRVLRLNFFVGVEFLTRISYRGYVFQLSRSGAMIWPSKKLAGHLATPLNNNIQGSEIHITYTECKKTFRFLFVF